MLFYERHWRSAIELLRDKNPKWRYNRKTWMTHRNRTVAKVEGALASIMENRRVAMHSIDGPEEFAEWLRVFHGREGNSRTSMTRTNVTRKPKDRSLEQERVDVVRAITGIGDKAAKALLAEFGSVHRVFTASRDELIAMPGVGPKTADHIIAVAGDIE